MFGRTEVRFEADYDDNFYIYFYTEDKTEFETYQSFLRQLWKLSPCIHCTPYLLLSPQPETVHQPLQNIAVNLASLQSSIWW